MPRAFNNTRIMVYGPSVGEHSRDQLYGPTGRHLRNGDVAVSPDILAHYPLGSRIVINGREYTVADVSYTSPGNPNHNTVEIWNGNPQLYSQHGGRIGDPSSAPPESDGRLPSPDLPPDTSSAPPAPSSEVWSPELGSLPPVGLPGEVSFNQPTAPQDYMPPNADTRWSDISTPSRFGEPMGPGEMQGAGPYSDLVPSTLSDRGPTVNPSEVAPEDSAFFNFNNVSPIQDPLGNWNNPNLNPDDSSFTDFNDYNPVTQPVDNQAYQASEPEPTNFVPENQYNEYNPSQGFDELPSNDEATPNYQPSTGFDELPANHYDETPAPIDLSNQPAAQSDPTEASPSRVNPSDANPGTPYFPPTTSWTEHSPDYIGYGQSPGSVADLQLMNAQSYGGAPNNTGATTDEGHNIFYLHPGDASGRIDANGDLSMSRYDPAALRAANPVRTVSGAVAPDFVNYRYGYPNEQVFGGGIYYGGLANLYPINQQPQPQAGHGG